MCDYSQLTILSDYSSISEKIKQLINAPIVFEEIVMVMITGNQLIVYGAINLLAATCNLYPHQILSYRS